jgi:hypothetical protein
VSQAETARQNRAGARLLKIMAPITLADLERERQRIERAYKVKLKPMSVSFLAAVRPHKRRDLHDTLAPLPAGQRRVAEALVAAPAGRTYAKTAEALGINLGTVYEHLRRVRTRHPEVYRELMVLRAEQLATRHAQAQQRAAAHSERWHRKQGARRFHRQFGRWPWESV